MLGTRELKANSTMVVLLELDIEPIVVGVLQDSTDTLHMEFLEDSFCLLRFNRDVWNSTAVRNPFSDDLNAPTVSFFLAPG